MNNSTFQKHPSLLLHNLYKQKNFQGANPIDAKVLFVGKDPNWAFDIETSPIFDLVGEYLVDGVKFWKKYNIHHPFLHPIYEGDGKKYHKAISKLQFKSDFASKISFIEIISFATTGMSSTNSKKFNDYLLSSENRKHLVELDRLLNDTGKLIFIFWGLIEHLKFVNKKTGLFEKLANIDKSKMIRTDLNKIGNIYVHKHFSMGVSPETLHKISDEISRNLS
jgi:hypothetical protein